MNNVLLVGRLVKEPEVIETEKGNKRTVVTIAVGRSYKNFNGEYETDFINIVLWNGIAENTAEYCKKGDIIGVKGRVETDTYEKDGERKNSMVIVAEKVTFLSSRTQEKDNSDRDDR